MGLLGVVAAVAVGVVLGGFVLSTAFWVLGTLIHIVAWAARLAVILMVAAVVVWFVSSRRRDRAPYG
jgi:hypothetical protein